jgi:hypothetical protein
MRVKSVVAMGVGRGRRLVVAQIGWTDRYRARPRAAAVRCMAGDDLNDSPFRRERGSHTGEIDRPVHSGRQPRVPGGIGAARPWYSTYKDGDSRPSSPSPRHRRRTARPTSSSPGSGPGDKADRKSSSARNVANSVTSPRALGALDQGPLDQGRYVHAEPRSTCTKLRYPSTSVTALILSHGRRMRRPLGNGTGAGGRVTQRL